jgi:hypothetical protein
MPATSQSSSASSSADRAGLKKILDGYLNALIANDASAIAAAREARFTENAIVLPLGDGLWKTAARIRPDTRLDFIDPVSGQAGSQMVIEERGGRPVIFQMRLKAALGLITEVESIAVHEGDLKFFDANGMKPLPIFYEPIPAAKRMTREKLRETVELYVDLLKVGSFTACGTRLHPEMVRWENGIVTSDYARLSTRENGPKRAAIPTRIPIIDEEYGLVYALLEFGLADVALCPCELFKIMDDEIMMLHIVIRQMPTKLWT